ncbi:hypothetical protein F5Y15DRAFT_227871 [Xylariaceae sp. FL0016]|nr:hypothetical protein F5Y15DRAFT_227871 [Xylariaceae sp. FL0016]
MDKHHRCTFIGFIALFLFLVFSISRKARFTTVRPLYHAACSSSAVLELVPLARMTLNRALARLARNQRYIHMSRFEKDRASIRTQPTLSHQLRQAFKSLVWGLSVLAREFSTTRQSPCLSGPARSPGKVRVWRNSKPGVSTRQQYDKAMTAHSPPVNIQQSCQGATAALCRDASTTRVNNSKYEFMLYHSRLTI